jgi:hypothetical protein
MILITLVLMAALLATAILVGPLEALRPKAAEETMFLGMAESLEGATGDLRKYLNARLGSIKKLGRLDCEIQLSIAVFSQLSSRILLTV